MKPAHQILFIGLILAAGGIRLGAANYPKEQLTAEVRTTAPAYRELLPAAGPWQFFKGTANPNAGWEVAETKYLGSTWGQGNGGFGFADGDDQTVLGDMPNRYSTVYIRNSFIIDNMVDPKRLKLQIDYDDGFIAFLNGREFARANAPGPAGQFAPFDAVATATREAAAGGGAVETYTGPAEFKPLHRGIPEREYVLAIQGLNRARNDDDFTLKAALLLEDFFVAVPAPQAELFGQATVPGVAAVLVNGERATLDAAQGTWTKTQALAPGMNRLQIQAIDAGGQTLARVVRDIVHAPATRRASGTLSGNTTWTRDMGVIEVDGQVTVPAGATLTISEGVTVLLKRGASIVTSGGAIEALGSAARPVYLLPADARRPWREIVANGAGSRVTMRFVEMVTGRVHLLERAVGLIEDSVLREASTDDLGLESQVIFTERYVDLTMRRCRVSRYYEMSFGARTRLIMEDCIAEYSEDDSIKIDDGTVDTVVRRTVVGPSSPGDDGIDFGAISKGTVENCIIHDIFDRGISIGEAATITVSNVLIYNCNHAIGVKDDSTAYIRQATLLNSGIGLLAYEKFAGDGPADVFLTNSIVWGNRTNLTTRDPETGKESGSTITVGYSVIQGSSVYRGTGNRNSDPQFADPANANYQLRSSSPARGTGLGGLDMGALFPLGPRQAFAVMKQPISQTVAPGASVALTVDTVGSPQGFQWRRNGADIPGATSAMLVLSNVDASREGQYDVVIRDEAGGITISTPALIYADSPPRIALDRSLETFESKLRLIGPAGKRFVLETSDNLAAWQPHSTNQVQYGLLEVAPPVAPVVGSATTYYRFRLLPD